MFGVVPLILVSLLEVHSNLIGSFHEILQELGRRRVLLKVLLSDVQRVELLLSEVVVSDLREGERLLVNLRGVDLDGGFLHASLLHLLLDLDGSLEILLV